MSEGTTENGRDESTRKEPATAPVQPKQGGTPGGADRVIDVVGEAGNGLKEPAGDETSSGSRPRWWRRLKTWQAGLIALVAAVGAVALNVGYVVDLYDRVLGSEPPQTERDASFTQLDLTEKDVSRHDYCQDEFKDEDTALQECLDQENSPGNVFSVGLRLEGYKDVCCSLLWTLKNVITGPVPDFEDVLAVADIEPRNELGDTRIFRIFVPNAPEPGNYRVHFVLEDRDGPIKEIDSETFSAR